MTTTDAVQEARDEDRKKSERFFAHAWERLKEQNMGQSPPVIRDLAFRFFFMGWNAGKNSSALEQIVEEREVGRSGRRSA